MACGTPASTMSIEPKEEKSHPRGRRGVFYCLTFPSANWTTDYFWGFQPLLVPSPTSLLKGFPSSQVEAAGAARGASSVLTRGRGGRLLGQQPLLLLLQPLQLSLMVPLQLLHHLLV